jgi:hypothetical protein
MIALIFQVVFIFFAMVVNVGLVINDKINLQNSVDIAAYYGAMKQAEVLGAMAQVNYQIRQIYKLMVWRLWALSDAGRNEKINDYFTSGVGALQEQAATWADGYNNPVVCIYNQFWFDRYDAKSSTPTDSTNACKTTSLNITNLQPVTLQAVQQLPLFAFLRAFEQTSQANANKFAAQLDDAGATNFLMTYKILLSYKYALLSRKIAMQRLQKLLILPANGRDRDFLDLSGSSVADTVERTLLNNLTAANKAGSPELDFHNSLNIQGQPQPFLVPIEVRVFLEYLDFNTGANKKYLTSNIRQFPVQPVKPSAGTLAVGDIADAISNPDKSLYPAATAVSFAQMSESSMQRDYKSVVGFEKNPWLLAYVHLKATTHPKMLFAPAAAIIFPGGAVKLEAESYAMPFGSRVGPWYYNKWVAGQPESSGSSNSEKIDALLPPRIGDIGAGTVLEPLPPNYSRFPGDNLGMRSEKARTIGLASAISSNISDLPHFQTDDYSNLVDDPNNPAQDPVVFRNSGGGSSPIRTAEVAGLAPDLFDSVYYSVDPAFMGDKFTGVFYSGAQQYFFSQICPSCHDLGGVRQNSTTFKDLYVAGQIALAGTATRGQAYWILDKPDYLTTSWTQEHTDQYDISSPTGMGRSIAQGGRVGYSVKIVSKKFLQKPMQLGGPGTPPAVILNPPNWAD